MSLEEDAAEDDLGGSHRGGQPALVTESIASSAQAPTLLRLLAAAHGTTSPFAEIAAALMIPGAKVVAVRPGIVAVAASLRQEAPHRYLPALAAWRLPAPAALWTFVRDGVEHAVQAEALDGDLVLLRHVRATETGHLAGPAAWSMVELDAARPFVMVDELPSGVAGRYAEADGIWIDWFHTIASTNRRDGAQLVGDQRRRWFNWLLEDLAVIAVASSAAVTTQPGQMDDAFRINPKGPTT